MRPSDQLLGTEVGNYKLTHILGEGGMGKVYIGEQARIASRVAIKVLSSQNPDLVKRFFAEAKAVNIIKHSSIVKVHDLGHLPDGRPYIVMELVEGETLRMLIVRDSPLSQGGVVKVLTQVLGALSAAHSVGIVHRDLKPDNIMVQTDGTAKVLDFGIAKLSPWLAESLARTKTGSRVGTPAYMSPEQVNGVEIDGRADIYSAGVVLFECLTGRRPFRADGEFDLMRAHLEKKPPSPRELRKTVSVELEQIVSVALAKKPSERFQTAAAMATALEGAARHLPPDQQRALAIQPMKDTVVNMVAPTVPVSDSAPKVDSLAPTDVSLKAPPKAAPQAATVLAKKKAPKPTKPAKRQRISPTTVLLAGAVVAVPVAITGFVYIATRTNTPQVSAKKPAKPTDMVVKAPDFATDAFEPVEYLDRARAHARTMLTDATLVLIIAQRVFPDGRVDLDQPTGYVFYSPKARDGGNGCLVTVLVNPKRITLVPDDRCDGTRAPDPTCSLPQVLERARAAGFVRDTPADVKWDGRGWRLTVVEGGTPATRVFDDKDCR